MAHTQRDPVCGMEVNAQDAAGTTQHRGQTFYFCSESCKNKFDENPEQYAKVQSAGKTA